ncbi:ATP-dependent zinc protease [Methylocaldum sp.]|uniref:ATP-dependent zinc protease family protein n=1 Tax=Methylocaldum sp. TaxID=1969727 RepID=UPI002D4DE716|nr:ATP-dependent zinc protease [Methylocaldum sp.]HYE34949.1 ATP-dependent zinc protease [Methylocaldum sp.]
MRFGTLIFLLTIPTVILGAEAQAKSDSRERAIMGWLESVFLKPWNIRATAKLDTGAKTSSLHAGNVEHFTRNGQEWVRFTLTGTDDNKSAVVERPLVRMAYIKERKSRATKRDVVSMVLCKNGKDYETEFTLVDRSNFNYPVLLGRSFLKDVALVDSAETFMYKADNDPCVSDASGQKKSK